MPIAHLINASPPDCIKSCVLAYDAAIAAADSNLQSCLAAAQDTLARKQCIATYAGAVATAANNLAECAENCGI